VGVGVGVGVGVEAGTLSILGASSLEASLSSSAVLAERDGAFLGREDFFSSLSCSFLLLGIHPPSEQNLKTLFSLPKPQCLEKKCWGEKLKLLAETAFSNFLDLSARPSSLTKDRVTKGPKICQSFV
jgi:hypothetical protein